MLRPLSSMPVLDLQSLAVTIRANQVGAFCDLASMVILIYDYLLTFKFEVALIWGTPWNIGKILYFLTKYSVIIEIVLLSYCERANFLDILFSVFHFFIDLNRLDERHHPVILSFRTWAIWSQSRNIAIMLAVLLAVFGIPGGFLTHSGLQKVTCMGFNSFDRHLDLTVTSVSQSPVPKIQNCFLTANHDILIFADYAIILVFETIILVLTLIKGIHHYHRSSSTLVATLYRDGILYYIYLTFFSIVNPVLLLLHPQAPNPGKRMQTVFHSILTGRILLHLRMAVLRDLKNSLTSLTPHILTSVVDRPRESLSTVIVGSKFWICDSESSGGPVDNGFEMT
ncbi:hypothetical protein K439DRAFT_1508816 [Ramaria rubella]|nr:hypothetical protein K439DRAFT_1508816 [Ramaria rubella]